MLEDVGDQQDVSKNALYISIELRSSEYAGHMTR